MFFESWRGWPQVHDHIVKRAGGAAHYLYFLIWGGLIVHAAKRALVRVVRNAALHKARFQALFGEFALAKSACEEASLIFFFFDVDYERAPEMRFGENHQ